MARLDDFQGDQRKRITDQYETFLHSLALLRGDRLSADQTSRIVGEAVAGASPDDPAKRQALIDQKAESLGIDKLPQEDQARWRRNIDRVQGKGHGVEHGHKVGEAMREHDAAVTVT